MFEVTDTVPEIIEGIGKRIAALRLSRGMTQAELAARCGISKNTLERMERGEGGARLEGFISVCQVIGLIKGLDALLPAVVLSPADILAGKSLPKRSRRKSQPRKVVWGDES